MNCEFCNKTFSTVYSLKTHKLNAKFCLKLQGTKIDNETNVDNNCKYCNESFSTKQSLTRHLKICKNKEVETIDKIKNELEEKNKLILMLKNEIHKKDLEIAELKSANEIYNNIYKESQDCLKEIAKQPKTTTKNTTNNNNNNNLLYMPILSLTKSTIEDKVKNNFTVNHLNDGQSGVANFAVDNLLKDKDENLMYVCTDPSRQMFAFMSENGKIEKDFKANKLANLIADDIIKKATSLSDDTINTNIKLSEIRQLKTDNSKFSNRLSTSLYKMGKINTEDSIDDDSIDDSTDNDTYISDSEYASSCETDIEECIEKIKKYEKENPGDDSVIFNAYKNKILEKKAKYNDLKK